MLCAHAKFAGMEVSTFDNNQQIFWEYSSTKSLIETR